MSKIQNEKSLSFNRYQDRNINKLYDRELIKPTCEVEDSVRWFYSCDVS